MEIPGFLFIFSKQISKYASYITIEYEIQELANIYVAQTDVA